MITNNIKIFLVFLILSFTLAGCGTISKAEQQKTLKSFLNQINKSQQPVSNAVTNLEIAISQFNGTDTSNISASAAKLKDASTVSASDFSTMSTPSGFPDDVDSLLSDAINNLLLAYHTEEAGADSFSKYIDSQNPNDLQTYKDKISTAKSYENQANDDIEQAKEKVGIK